MELLEESKVGECGWARLEGVDIPNGILIRTIAGNGYIEGGYTTALQFIPSITLDEFKKSLKERS